MDDAGKLTVWFSLVKLILNPPRRHRTIGPSAFRLGDIVEAQLAIICVPVAHGKLRMRLVLRSLSLENSSITEVSLHQLICDLSSINM